VKVSKDNKIRQALAELVGADTSAELQAMRQIVEALPATTEDKRAMLNAIDVLIGTTDAK
jgi:hypothetical protein